MPPNHHRTELDEHTPRSAWVREAPCRYVQTGLLPAYRSSADRVTPKGNRCVVRVVY